jgi:addiction module HigA family antidote
MIRLPTHRIACHPGKLLQKLYLDEMNISQVAFAKHLGISLRRLNEIINGKRNVTPETAILLGQALGQTPEFWLNAQMAFDLTRLRGKVRKVRRLPALAKANAA